MARPRIFLTHRHRYAADFWRLRGRMKARFLFDDMSVHTYKFDGYVPEGELARTIESRIYQSNVFIAVGRRATSNSEWCTWEIDMARQYRKFILCYRPYGMDPRHAPKAATSSPYYLGHFTQVRVLENRLEQLGLEVYSPDW